MVLSLALLAYSAVILVFQPFPGLKGHLEIQSLTGDSSGNLVIHVKNAGSTNLRFDPNKCTYINGALVNSNLTQSVLNAGQETTLIADYQFDSTSSYTVKVVCVDGTSAQATQSPSITGSTVNITIASNPLGSGYVEVDGIPETTPISFAWTPGSTHSLEAVSQVQGPSGIRYVWSGWSDGGTQNHTIAVPSSPQTVTAEYQTQYEVTFTTNPNGAGSISPSGDTWWAAGSSISITVYANSGYTFNSWVYSAQITIADSSSPSTTATINGQGNIQANFTQTNSATPSPSQETITITSNPTGSGFVKVDGTIHTTPYSVSWTAGSTHTLEAVSDVTGGTGVQFIWTDWSTGAAIQNTYLVSILKRNRNSRLQDSISIHSKNQRTTLFSDYKHQHRNSASRRSQRRYTIHRMG